jgi:hypothetical protein
VDLAGYPEFVPAGLTLSRTTKLWFLAIWTTLAAIMSLALAFLLWEDLHGGTATATVVRVDSRTVYAVSFVTTGGTHCQTSSRRWPARSQPVEVGDTFPVHYSNHLSCDNVEPESGGRFERFGGYLVAPILAVAGLIAFIVLKRRPPEVSEFTRRYGLVE